MAQSCYVLFCCLPGSLKLKDLHSKLPGFKTRPGLGKWKVNDDRYMYILFKHSLVFQLRDLVMNEILILLIPKVRLFELNCIGDVIIDNLLYCLKYTPKKI